MERLQTARQRVVGSKETTKHLEKGHVDRVYVARDAQPSVVAPVRRLAREKGVEVVECESMAALGSACGIKVRAATAAILKA